MDVIDAASRAATGAGGQLLGAGTALMAAGRPAAKPLHPRGSVTSGVLHRFGTSELSGAPWLDEVGEEEVLVRHSRAVGLPEPWPDVFGLALRVPTPGGRHGDLLLASTGLGRLSRFTLTVGRSPSARPLTTLLPYRTATGPVLISAMGRDERDLDLCWAWGGGEWRRFATVRLPAAPAAAPDSSISFDPVRNTLPGLEVYEWVRRLREPSYLTARRSRSGSV